METTHAGRNLDVNLHHYSEYNPTLKIIIGDFVFFFSGTLHFIWIYKYTDLTKNYLYIIGTKLQHELMYVITNDKDTFYV